MPMRRPSILILLAILMYMSTSQAASSSLPIAPSISLIPQNGSLSAVNCINSNLWCPRYVNTMDCRKAMTAFYIRKVSDLLLSHLTYEFLAQNAHPSTRYPIQNTPERYVWRTCTMALALVADVTELSSRSRHVAATDLATYREVWNAISDVLNQCLRSSYTTIGTNGSALKEEVGPQVGFRCEMGWNSVVSGLTLNLLLSRLALLMTAGS